MSSTHIWLVSYGVVRYERFWSMVCLHVLLKAVGVCVCVCELSSSVCVSVSQCTHTDTVGVRYCVCVWVWDSSGIINDLPPLFRNKLGQDGSCV